MKQLLSVFIIGLALMGCTSKTAYGPCIGAFEEENPKLHYHVSGWNVAMGIVFFELLAPPIVVVASDAKCPVATTTEWSRQ